MHAKKYLKNIGLESEDYHFFKRVGKGLLCTYAVLGAPDLVCSELDDFVYCNEAN